MSIQVNKFLDVASGVQPGQFTIGNRETLSSLEDLDPIYKQLLDGPVAAAIAVMGSAGRPNLTPVWFDYSGSVVMLNLAAHRKKVEWLRANPQASFLLINPENAYHWVSIKATAFKEIHEDDPVEGDKATQSIDRLYTKYTGNEPPYPLRDESVNERRILFLFSVDAVATFGQP